jgi:hypothetical protein
MIFQIGIELVEERTTDLIVRVNAADLQEARRLALIYAREKADQFTTPDDLLKNRIDWESNGVAIGGHSENDYSDMGPHAYPYADLDFTDREPPPDPRQIALPLDVPGGEG